MAPAKRGSGDALMRLFFEAMAIYTRAWLGAFGSGQRVAAPLTPRRILLLLLFPVFMIVQLLHWVCLALDHVFFPAFRRQSIHRPVFVLGVPRSGTTFLHRALADDGAFTTTRTWELLFAPSLCQRYLIRGLIGLDKLMGAPLAQVLRWLVKRGGRELEAIHAVGLDAAEEDYLALLPAAGCFFASLAFPGSSSLAALGKFNTMSEGRRRRLMDHYHALMQRHVYAHGGRQLLSKNAAFASWGDALRERFPDAVMILCIREPLRAVSSQVSSLQPARSLFATDPDGEELPRLFRQYYERWFTDLARLAIHRQALVIDQEWMAGHGDEVLDRIYSRLGRERPENAGAAATAPVSAPPHRHDPGHYDLQRESLDATLWEAYAALSRQALLQR
ncbi:sulfotransferase [Congregibacter litoralis]|uniref:Sulfotransferase family n=1 Tax=Congregibacter litoralis KT71 TaxID=314285 RepID=A4ABQ0_9GAMM|nr:sulfotransferase [Congregibacter litoralis]EAQ96563.1 Sulfotransferase family [Congregibacter litoralis KT71]